jgi:transcriptional regulator with XRE-family HTH domain
VIYILLYRYLYIVFDMIIDHLTPVDSTLTELGRRLALARKQQGLSQQNLADAAGIGVATLRRIEGGSDGQMGSWVKVLRALDRIHAVNNLLPEVLRSPMADARAARKKQGARKSGKRPAGEKGDTAKLWDDQAP